MTSLTPADAVAPLPPEQAVPVRKEGRFHHGDLRMSLLAAASRAISARGDTDISLRELAKGLGVTHAATYRHFASKAELLAALATRGWERLAEIVSDISDQEESEDEAETLRRVGERIIAFGRANPGPLRTMHLKELRQGRPFAQLEEAADAVRDGITAILAAGQSHGSVRKDLPAEELAEAQIHALTGLAFGTLGRSPSEAEALTAHFLEVLVSGVKPVRRPAAAPTVERKDKKKDPVEGLTLDLFG